MGCVLGVVLGQDLEGQLHALQALLKIGLALSVEFLLRSTDLVHLSLRGSHGGKRLLKSGDLLLELSGLGGHLVHLCGKLFDLGCFLGLLLRRFLQLLVTISLVGCISSGILLQLGDELRNEVLHLGEGVGLACDAAALDDGGEALGQEAQSLRVIATGKVADSAHDFEDCQVRARAQRGDRLEEGCAIAEGSSAVGGLLDCRLGLSESLELLAPALGLLLVVLCLGEALLVQVCLGLRVGLQVLGGGSEVPLGCGLGLGSSCGSLLGLGKVLVGELDLVFQGLLQHFVVVEVGGLDLPGLGQVLLSRVQKLLQGLDDAAALGLVDLGSGSAQGLQVGLLAFRVRITLAAGGLREHCREALRVGCGEHGGLHHRGQGGGEALRIFDLDEGALNLLGHLALEDGDGTPQHGDCLRQLRLLGFEVLGLLVPNHTSSLQVSLICCDASC
mmetsp:Transcript_19658/g.29422  ORF Transcript_19658/g.29422 Transcript_19658/m.29422 type:complete len:446 (-) Transcript_19658:61-1398(-)